MLILELRFPGGRYHATPYGHHVNEGLPEWPPAPYRLVRALYDAWKRRRADWPAERVEPLLRLLAMGPPRIWLPPARTAHTRSYLSKNTGSEKDRALIFDSFVCVDPGDPVYLGWEVEAPPEVITDLDELLRQLNYLGRSESWVQAQMMREVREPDWNCDPAGWPPTKALSEDRDGEDVRVACLVPPGDYRPEQVRTTKGSKKAAAERSWLDALADSTADLLKEQRSDPLVLRSVLYKWRRGGSGRRTVSAGEGSHVRVVRYAVEGKVRPRVVATVELAEALRIKLMGIHRKIQGGDQTRLSPRFSGKDEKGGPLRGHRHVYILPLDEDKDGIIDHLLIHCREPFNDKELRALDWLGMQGMWQRDGKPDLRLVPVQWEDRLEKLGNGQDKLYRPALRFVSVTPYATVRHYKKGRGTVEEWLKAEVGRDLGLFAKAMGHEPAPGIVSIERVAGHRLQTRGRDIRWGDFRRSRKADEVPPLHGGFALELDRDYQGPFALGYGAHYGLGLFVPGLMT